MESLLTSIIRTILFLSAIILAVSGQEFQIKPSDISFNTQDPWMVVARNNPTSQGASCTVAFKNCSVSWTDKDDKSVNSTAMGGRVYESNGILMITKPIDSDFESYTCHVNCGAQGSASRLFNLYSKVSLERTQAVQTTVVGEMGFHLECPFDGSEIITESWAYPNHTLITASDQFTISESSLSFHNVSRTDSGIYVCQAQQMIRNQDSFVEKKNIQLIVNYPPFFPDTAPYAVPASIGHQSTFTCQVSAIPEAQIHWGFVLENGTLINVTDSQDNESLTVLADTLSVFVKNESFLREYVCQAHNMYGTASRTFKLVPSVRNATVGDFSSIGGTKVTGVLVTGLNASATRCNTLILPSLVVVFGLFLYSHL